MSASTAAAVTRQRLAGLQLLTQLTLVGLQEGSSVVRLTPEQGAPPSTAAAAAASTHTTAAASSSAATPASSSDSDSLPPLSGPLASLRVSSTFVCSTCRVAFELGEELRAHARTPWHVHNVKAQSKAPTGASSSRSSSDTILSEVEFEEMQLSQAAKKDTGAAAAGGGGDAAEDSASSGASSDDDESSNNKQRRPRDDADDDGNVDTVGSSRVSFFTPTQTVTVWKSMLLSPGDPPSHLPLSHKVDPYVSALRSLPLVRQVCVLMVSGGRFAAAIWHDDKLLTSKNFQRYTTRRKQGGSQSAHDNAKGAAQSIGSSIRRKETVRYWEECTRILGEWEHLLADCQRIFLFAPGANRQHLLRCSAQLAVKSDPRIRNVPFATHRPTLAELQRIHQWLGTVEFAERDNPPQDLEALIAAAEGKGNQGQGAQSKKQAAAAAAAAAASSSASATPARPAPVNALASLPEPVRDDALLNAIRTDGGDLVTLQSLISSGYERSIPAGHARFRPLIYEAALGKHAHFVTWLLESGYCSSHEGEGVDEQVVDVLLEEGTGGKQQRQGQGLQDKIVCWGPLHVACVQASEPIILSLLLHGADPTRRDSRGRLPFTLLPPSAAGSATRLAARRLAGSTPDMLAKWAWAEGAELPPLTAEAEAAADEARRAKAREKKKAANARAKERAQADKAEAALQAERDAESLRQAQQAAALKASAQAVREATSARAQAQAGLSDREKRALAAERRMGAAKGTGPTCALCALPITKAPFEQSGFTFCSIPCLQQHKLQRDATAAPSASAAKVVAHNPR